MVVVGVMQVWDVTPAPDEPPQVVTKASVPCPLPKLPGSTVALGNAVVFGMIVVCPKAVRAASRSEINAIRLFIAIS